MPHTAVSGPDLLSELKKLVAARAAEEIQLPDALISVNPWVSPRSQARLLKYLEAKLAGDDGVNELMPPHPQAPDAYDRLAAYIRRSQRELQGRRDQSFLFFANLALSWMRGRSIPELIEGIAEYKRGQGEDVHYPKLIRKTLENIERDLRFRLVRLSSCYNSVFKFCLLGRNLVEEAARVPAIPLYLEMGASSETMLSFMDLGLSRITANLLLSSASDQFMDSVRAKEWLRMRPAVVQRLPAACMREVTELLG